MIQFFNQDQGHILALESVHALTPQDLQALVWLFEGAVPCEPQSPLLQGWFVGPRKEMITPWSTTAVEITQNMNIAGITRIEEFFAVEGPEAAYDPMLQQRYHGLDSRLFESDRRPEPVRHIHDLEAYNRQEGLALSADEMDYLRRLSQKIGRPLTDSEVFGFSQVNSEHCRHKIFNGIFVIDGQERPSTLFKLIKRTSAAHPGRIVSAYKDNCAFLAGPKEMLFFAPAEGHTSSYFGLQAHEAVISLKAETHNFPTTVEPFNGAATGSGGEIRDRMAGGQGSYPLAGTAVYMTPYPRFEEIPQLPQRKWLYQTPEDLLIKASNGASDFGNKFGQPLICGSLLCFEHRQAATDRQKALDYGYDKVIMLAGGVGYAKKAHAQKDTPQTGDKVVLLGGDNYRIGMGGGAVSSVATGEYQSAIELNAVQRANPEMQKRVYNALRAMSDSPCNPIITVHDHGAGGHLNCLSELVEATGGKVDIAALPIGDASLSDKEVVGNESQERMGLVLKEEDLPRLQAAAQRERAPFYVIGQVTGDHRFTFENSRTQAKAIDLELQDMFGSAPVTVMEDRTTPVVFEDKGPQLVRQCQEDPACFDRLLSAVLQNEAVACKDWLTNKVDRSVTGLIARQQCQGQLQLPLSDYGLTALSYAPAAASENWPGMATSIGHHPVAGLVSAAAGSRLSIAEALTNMVFAPLEDGLQGVSLSANWMWPCRNTGEDARLYEAVQAASDFAVALGVNIPTGKDSLSMTQKYPNGDKVLAPGTVIISTLAQATDVRKAVGPAAVAEAGSELWYLPFDCAPLTLGATALAQSQRYIGTSCADIHQPEHFARCFAAVQSLLQAGCLHAGHDVSAGGLITCLLEMCFGQTRLGLEVDPAALDSLCPGDLLTACFAERSAVVMQVKAACRQEARALLQAAGLEPLLLAVPTEEPVVKIGDKTLDVAALRRLWFRPSYLLDRRQSGEEKAAERFENFDKTPLEFTFPQGFAGKLPVFDGPRPKAAIIREKGSNGDREMAWMLYLAGFDVKDVHMTDLASGREDLQDIRLIVFVGGFSNADVLGSAKGWAGAFLYNPKAKAALDAFYARPDTLSLGICNGCQLMAELGLITPEDRSRSPKMRHNRSHKFESNFVGIHIEKSPAVMLQSLAGSRLGIWVAHGEGRFDFPEPLDRYPVAARYAYDCYPANPNGSPEAVAAVCSADGRHLAMMPHPERCIYPWNWALYPQDRQQDEVSPWLSLFLDARAWLKRQA